MASKSQGEKQNLEMWWMEPRSLKACICPLDKWLLVREEIDRKWVSPQKVNNEVLCERTIRKKDHMNLYFSPGKLFKKTYETFFMNEAGWGNMARVKYCQHISSHTSQTEWAACFSRGEQKIKSRKYFAPLFSYNTYSARCSLAKIWMERLFFAAANDIIFAS